MVRNWKITHKELGSIPCNTSFEVWGWETKREKYDDKAHGGSSRFPSLATNPQISQTSTCTLPAASWPFFGSLCCNTLSLFKRSTLLGASLLLISSSMHKLNLPVNQIMFESVQGHLNQQLAASTFASLQSTLWLFNIAMENGPFIDGLPGFTY